MEPRAIFYQPQDLKQLIKECIQEGFNTDIFQNNKQAEEILNLKEAAILLRLSPHTVRKHTKNGLIPRHLPDIKGYRFLRADLLKYQSYYRTK